ncbi:AAA family ATPase [Wenzhouxiangella sp. XN79A]|uniref:AAA family ATPase n=1 Tax=Wenzhouxiangella sp. XN79A TaxID=2724193 RepID=UPI00144AC4D8|nr:AAA family ATPase [Wenzhouxiangella sp. XN79A]NKI34525.1 AAA family ATPase [Wenzhouxiangella sp. XN79A]
MSVFVERLVIKNYKSIEACDLRLRDLSFFVGPNGSGKSNILDSLEFIKDALNTNIDNALRERGGINEVRRRSKGHPTHFGVRAELILEENRRAVFAFEIVSKPKGGFQIGRETCRVEVNGEEHFYEVRKGQLAETNIERPASPSSNHFYLLSISGLSGFEEVFEGLRNMGFYSINPQVIRDLQSPNPGEILQKEGKNLASVLWNLQQHERVTEEITEYLKAIVPSVRSVERVPLGHMETIEFRQGMKGDKYPWRFNAASMSDGTLRTLGIITAAFQESQKSRIPLVGIEEPEIALHPAAAGVLMDALMRASDAKQILVTSHSADLLDSNLINIENVVAVSFKDGITYAGPVDSSTKEAITKQLTSVGEMLRLDQIEINADIFESASKQLDLFGKRI